MNDTTDNPMFPEPMEQQYIRCTICGHMVDIEETVNGECAEHLTKEEAEEFYHIGQPQTKAEYLLSQCGEKRFFEHYHRPIDRQLLEVLYSDTPDVEELRAMMNEIHDQVVISNPELCE